MNASHYTADWQVAHVWSERCYLLTFWSEQTGCVWTQKALDGEAVRTKLDCEATSQIDSERKLTIHHWVFTAGSRYFFCFHSFWWWTNRRRALTLYPWISNSCFCGRVNCIIIVSWRGCKTLTAEAYISRGSPIITAQLVSNRYSSSHTCSALGEMVKV